MNEKVNWQAARDFVFSNARLLDRVRFQFHFEEGGKDAVLRALKAYQNEDGGFGHALEPDVRCPQSQPVAVEYALHVLHELKSPDRELLKGISRFLEHATLPQGGLPLALMSVMDYPHAPWWNIESEQHPNINPTGRIIGMLLEWSSSDPLVAEMIKKDWFRRNVDFLWSEIEAKPHPSDFHEGVQWIEFLLHAPESEKVTNALKKLDGWLQSSEAIEKDPHKEGYVHKVLDWAPTPGSYAHKFASDSEVERHLAVMIDMQQEDGGWPIHFPATSPLAELEWRGMLTVDRLITLRSYGKL